jgi:hypothetical protein
VSSQWLHLWLHSPVVSEAREWSRSGYGLPTLLGRSPLISGSTTLKASVPRGTGGSNPSASATVDQH